MNCTSARLPGRSEALSQKLDYLKGLGINAVEVLPITQNPLFPDHTPPDHDWGYDPVQLFAIKSNTAHRRLQGIRQAMPPEWDRRNCRRGL